MAGRRSAYGLEKINSEIGRTCGIQEKKMILLPPSVLDFSPISRSRYYVAALLTCQGKEEDRTMILTISNASAVTLRIFNIVFTNSLSARNGS